MNVNEKGSVDIYSKYKRRGGEGRGGEVLGE